MSDKKTKLSSLILEATRKCNLNCPYCYIKSKEMDKNNALKNNELSTDEIKGILKQLKNINSYANVAWAGGEFLLRDDSEQLLEYCSRELNITSIILTNATLLNYDKLKRIKYLTNEKIVFSFSINSLKEDINQWSRDDDPKKVLNTMEMCDKLNIAYVILTTITKSNLSQFNELISYFQNKNIVITRTPLVKRGSGSDYYKDLSINVKDMKQIIYPVLLNNPVTYGSYTPFFGSPEFIKKECERIPFFIKTGCWISDNFLAITPEGDATPCPLLGDNIEVGNIRKSSLKEIIESKEFKNIISRDNLKGKCGRCRYKHTCGGCRAIAYYYSGDYFAEDPLCFFEPEDENTRSEYENITNNKFKIFLDTPTRMHNSIIYFILRGYLFPPFIAQIISRILIRIFKVRLLVSIHASLNPIMARLFKK